MDKKDQVVITGTQKELEVIKLMREINYGKMIITIKDGMPIHAEVSKSFLIK